LAWAIVENYLHYRNDDRAKPIWTLAKMSRIITPGSPAIRVEQRVWYRLPIRCFSKPTEDDRNDVGIPCREISKRFAVAILLWVHNRASFSVFSLTLLIGREPIYLLW
jgi:hypothetical protein